MRYGYTQLVLQIDSLHKYCSSRRVDVIICDEIESILSQLKYTKDFNAEIAFFYQGIMKANKAIFLDGHLNLSTINLIQKMTGDRSMSLIYNMFKPKTNYECIIRPISYNSSRDYDMFCYLYSLLNCGKKVAMMCSSLIELKTIVQLIKTRLPTIKIKCYTSADRDTVTEDNILNQRQLKLDDFSRGLNNIFREQEPDLLIYTSTLTSVVSVDIEYFDNFIGCMFANTVDILSFVQSIHRVRNVRNKIIEIYYHNVRSYLPTTIRQLNITLGLQSYNINERNVHTETYLQARSNTMKVYSSELLLTHLHRMGYKIKIEDTQINIPIGQ